MIPPITDMMIAQATHTRKMEAAGLAYWRQGRVHTLEINSDESVITAHVRGSTNQPYTVSVTFPDSAGKAPKAHVKCTCPVGFDCKHGAAVLYAAQAQLHGATNSQRPGIAAPKGSPPPPLPAHLQQWVAETQNRALATRQDAPEPMYVFAPHALHESKGRKGKAAETLAQTLAQTLARALPQRVAAAVWVWGQMRDGARWYRPDVHVLRYATTPFAPGDAWLIRRMDTYGGGDLDSSGMPQGLAGADWVERVIATGRARWRKPDGPVLHWGDDWPADWRWVTLPNAEQRLTLHDAALGDALPQGQILLATAPPIRVDDATGRLHRAVCRIDPVLAQRLLLMPPLPPSAVAQMAQHWPGIAGPDVPAPALGNFKELGQIQPVPVLTLMPDKVDAYPRRGQGFGAYSHGMSKVDIAVARLRFDYGGYQVTPLTIGTQILGKPVFDPRTESDPGFTQFTRDLKAEAAGLNQVLAMGLCPLDGLEGLKSKPTQQWDFAPHSLAQATDFAAFMHDAVPILRGMGWRIEYAPKWQLTITEVAGADLQFDVAPSGQDWFDISLGARIAGEVFDILPVLRRLLAIGGPDVLDQLGDTIAIALAPGRVVKLPTEPIKPVLAMLLEMALHDREGSNKLRLKHSDIAVLADLEQASTAQIAWRGGDSLRRLARALTRIDTEPTATPPGFKATLRPYQQQGLDWLQALHGAGMGGVLADDMGLGKTVQALAHIATLKAAGKLDGPTLIICPTSVLPNWQAEIAKFTPNLCSVLWHGTDRQGQRETLGTADIILSSYPLLLRDHELFAQQNPALILFDEAHMLKNPKTAGFKAAKTLKAGQVIALSGTPVENQLTDVWSLMELVVPDLLGSLDHFKRAIDRPITRDNDAIAKAVLRRRLRPFMLRRTKDEVASDLPEKTEIPEWIDLEKAQSASYESLRLLMQQRVRDEIARVGLLRSQIVFLDALLKLRQLCCDPRLVPQLSGKETKTGSAKLARLLEMLPELLREGRRIILFSQFTSMLDLIKPELDALDITYVEIRGETQDRTTPVKQFQAGKVPIILVSLKAGGTGLNLTAADTVILYDPWWNPAVEAQAIDRAHRIGQTKPVFVHRLIAKGTIEEKILSLQDKKRALAAMLWEGDSAGPAKLTEEDVAFLLG